jgi:queuine tRNA-ribosyltransferase
LYVEGLNLVERWQQASEPFVIWDVGLGGAANVAAVWAAATRFPGRLDLRITSFDRTLAPLAFAVNEADRLGYFGEILEPARALVRQGHVAGGEGLVRMEWHFVPGDFVGRMSAGSGGLGPAPHAVLYDPHSPKANPEMWTEAVFHGLASRLDPDRPCGLATYSRSTAVRVALLLAGFHVGFGPGTDSKEESTVAGNRPEWVGRPLDVRWWQRLRRSGSAEPWRVEGGVRPPGPLTEATWERLSKHPQYPGEEAVQSSIAFR